MTFPIVFYKTTNLKIDVRLDQTPPAKKCNTKIIKQMLNFITDK